MFAISGITALLTTRSATSLLSHLKDGFFDMLKTVDTKSKSDAAQSPALEIDVAQIARQNRVAYLSADDFIRHANPSARDMYEATAKYNRGEYKELTLVQVLALIVKFSHAMAAPLTALIVLAGVIMVVPSAYNKVEAALGRFYRYFYQDPMNQKAGFAQAGEMIAQEHEEMFENIDAREPGNMVNRFARRLDKGVEWVSNVFTRYLKK